MTRELKLGPTHLKKIEGNEVIGIAAVMGNLDSYDDRLWPGAFTKTLRERFGKIYHLWQHDFGCPPIANITDLREVSRDELPPVVLQEAPEAQGGLQVTRVYHETERAQEVLINLKAGVPLQMSFAYDAIKYDYEEKPGAKYEWERIRNLREVRLYETSDVLWGANDATVAAKSGFPIEMLLHMLGDREIPLEALIKNLGSRELPLEFLVKNLGSRELPLDVIAKGLSTREMPLEAIVKSLGGRTLDTDALLTILCEQLDRQAKAGQRNAGADQERINTIGTLAFELGATSVVLADTGDDDTETDSSKDSGSRADDTQSLTAAAYSYRLKAAERALQLRSN